MRLLCARGWSFPTPYVQECDVPVGWVAPTSHSSVSAVPAPKVMKRVRTEQIQMAVSCYLKRRQYVDSDGPLKQGLRLSQTAEEMAANLTGKHGGCQGERSRRAAAKLHEPLLSAGDGAWESGRTAQQPGGGGERWPPRHRRSFKAVLKCHFSKPLSPYTPCRRLNNYIYT